MKQSFRSRFSEYRSLLSWKVYHVIGWLLLTSVVGVYSVRGVNTPRPWYLFFGIGTVLSIFSLSILDDRSALSRQKIASFICGILVNNWVLKYTLRARVPLVGSDQYAHYVGRTGPIVENGFVSTQFGMYSDTPLLHVWLAINAIVTDLWVFDLRFAAIASSTLFPLLFVILGRQIDTLKTGLFAALISVPFPLFMRTGALFDSESLVLPWFALILFLILRSTTTKRRFYPACVIVLMTASSYIHFLYPIVISSIVGGTVITIYMMNPVVQRTLTRLTNVGVPVIGTIAASLFIGYRIIYTDSGASKFVGLGIGGATISAPSNPIKLLFPSSGRVGQMATTGEGGSIQILLNNSPLVVFLLLASIGGVYTIWLARKRSQLFVLLIASIVATFVMFFGLIGYSSGQAWQLGFRFYYFVTIIGIVHVGIGLTWLSKIPILVPLHRFPQPISMWAMIKVVGVALIMVYSTFSPMTTYGNNVDSPFSELSTAIDKTDREQFAALDRHLEGRKKIDFRTEELNNPSEDTLKKFGPTAERSRIDELYITKSAVGCKENNQLWSSNRYGLCG